MDVPILIPAYEALIGSIVLFFLQPGKHLLVSTRPDLFESLKKIVSNKARLEHDQCGRHSDL